MSKRDKNVPLQRLSLRAKRGNPANQKAFMPGSIWIAASLRSSQRLPFLVPACPVLG